MINKTIPNMLSTKNIPLLPNIFIFLLLIIISTLLISCKPSETSEDYKRNHPSAKKINIMMSEFVPGNKNMIIFSYSTVFWSKIATYNLKTGEFNPFNNIPIKQITFPTFSSDSKKIAFLGGRDEYGLNRNIYIMNADGSGIRQITNFDFTEEKRGDMVTSSYVIAPSFSPDGKRIIYAKSRLKRKRAYPLQGIMDSAWDVYELDVATGIERQLTNYDFYEISWPHYMPDGKRFIFSAEGPVNSTGKGPKNFKEYEEMYQKNFIFIMDGVINELKPAFTNGSNSARPCIGHDGSIFFVSETNEKENLNKTTRELYIYKNGLIKRITNFAGWLEFISISSDGQHVIFSKKSDKNARDRTKWIMKKDGTELSEVKIPMNFLNQ